MATSRLDILINAQNKASGELRKVDSQLAGLSGSIGMATKALGAFGVALGAREVAQFTIDAARSADAAARLESSFNDLASSVGANADEMLSAMQKASMGMITDSELMLSANKAMMLGVANSADEMSKLLEVAAERGQAMGLSTAQAFNDIVTGIGRQSAMILDNLGIVIDTEQAYADYADQLGKTADELTDAEKKQAFLNEAIAEADGSTDVAIDAFAQLATSVDDLKIAFGSLIDEPVSGFISEIAGEFSDLAKLLDASQYSWKEVVRVYKELWEESKLDQELARMSDYNAATGYATKQNQELLAAKQAVAEAGTGEASAVANTADEYKAVKDQVIELAREYEAAAISADVMAGNVDGAARRANSAAMEYFTSLTSWVQTMVDSGASAEQIMSQLGEASSNFADSLAQVEGVSLASVQSEIMSLAEGYRAAALSAEIMGGNTANAAGVAQAAAKEYFSQLRSWLQSMVDSGASAEEIMSQLGSVSRQIANDLEVAGQAGTNAGSKIEAGMMRGAFAAAQLVSSIKNVAAGLASFGTETRTARDVFEETFGAGTVTKLGSVNDALAESKEISGELGTSWGSGGGISAGISAAQSQLSSFASKVKSVFGIGPVAGVDANDLLPREDAVNENARRLADIAVNGFKGQDWMGEFASEVPDIFAQLKESGDPQGTAAQLLRDFQDGLLNGTEVLIDREAAKEKVRRMIMGEQSTSDLANSIAQELQAEMGIAMGSAQDAAAAVLGGGATGTGEAIIAEVRAAEGRIKNAGADAGKEWGSMFLGVVGDNVPGELVRLLASLVTPAVQAGINSQQSRGAAVAVF